MSIDEKVKSEELKKIDGEILRQFKGSVEEVNEDCIYVALVDLFDNTDYDVTFEVSAADHEVGIGDRVEITIYQKPNEKPKVDLRFLPHPPLSTEAYERAKRIFGEL